MQNSIQSKNTTFKNKPYHISSSEMSGANHSLVLHVLQRFDPSDAVGNQTFVGDHCAPISACGARRSHVLFANGFPLPGHLHAAAGCGGGGRDGTPIAHNALLRLRLLLGALLLLLLLYTTVFAA